MIKLSLIVVYLCILRIQHVLCVCKTSTGLTCLTEKDPQAQRYFQVFGWKTPCFDFRDGHWCMYELGKVKPCECTKGCCGLNENAGGSEGTESNQGDIGESGSSEGSSGGSSGSGKCDSSSVEDFKGCTEQKKTFCPLTSEGNGQGLQNTMCLYCGENKNACGGKICEYGIHSEEDKQRIVDKHNEWRSYVANGKETRGVGGPQPSASNMYKLEWDDNLAAGAQMWALQCQNGHDKNRLTPEFNGLNIWVGQNIASAWSSVKSFHRDYEGMMQGWYDEVENFPPKNVKSYSKTGATGVIGHYTALIWGSTTKVGCGFVMYYDKNQPRYPYKKVLICNYGPGGNILGWPVYNIGATGSECPKGQKDGLCL